MEYIKKGREEKIIIIEKINNFNKKNSKIIIPFPSVMSKSLFKRKKIQN